jgi:hypothetical protein
MKHMDLIGKNKEEIDEYLFEAHRGLLEFLEMHTEGRIKWDYFSVIQNSLMDATGYMNKKVNYSGKEVVVIFDGNITPSNPLYGKGKNELEAICDACNNLVNDPSKYNTFSIKYINQLKEKAI